MQPTSAGLQPPSPPPVSVLQPPPEAPPAPDNAVEVPKLSMPPGEMVKVVEEVAHSVSQNEALVQQLQQVRALTWFQQGRKFTWSS